MATKIDSVSARARLKPRREPYWHRVAKGAYVGFRKMTADTAGSWIARHRDDATGKQSLNALGPLDAHPAHERFDKACNMAADWFKHMGMGGSAEVVTVKGACDRYVRHIRQEKGDKPADDLAGRFRRWVEPDPIARIVLSKLTREHVKIFRKRLMEAPVTVNKDGSTRERAKDSINRDMTALRAALNYAMADGLVTTDFAWREALKPIKDAGRRRDNYLDRVQRRALVKHAPRELAEFLSGLALLPLRPGALAQLCVADFDSRLSMLRIGKDKAGKDRKIKLPPATAELFVESAAGKPPTAPLLSRADGKAWDKDAWKGPVKEAARAADLPPETTAYTLRHSTITDLVHAGLDLLTVAQISGTSVAMIEKHYGHLRSDVAAQALAKLAL